MSLIILWISWNDLLINLTFIFLSKFFLHFKNKVLTTLIFLKKDCDFIFSQKIIIQLAYNLFPPPPKTLTAHPHEIILWQSPHYIFMKEKYSKTKFSTFLHNKILHTTIPFIRLVWAGGNLVTSLIGRNTASIQTSKLVAWTWAYIKYTTESLSRINARMLHINTA